jgi:hypothetical protein
MEIYKKILILILIILFFYIGYRLLKKINCCNKNKFEGLENLNATNEDIELNKLKNSENVTLQSIHETDTKLPLSQYVIKASYNSALTGKYVNSNMIKYVLSRGCRFLDFEIFLIDGKPQIAYTSDSKYKTIQSKNNILLDEVLSTIVSNAFTNTSPNRNDPLFIHMRIKSSDSSNDDIYKSIAKSLSVIKDSLYTKPIDNKTKLSDIMGKIVIIVDSTINYDYKKYTNCKNNEKNCYDFKKYINLESGKELMNIERYSNILSKQNTPPRIINDVSTDVKYIKLALPDFDVKQTKNPNFKYFVADYGIQIITYRYYIKDDNLKNLEEIFNENKYGIVPLANMVKYFEKKKEEDSN